MSYLRVNPDYKPPVVRKVKPVKIGPDLDDMSDPETNKLEIAKLTAEFKGMIKQPKISKKDVVSYVESVIEVINQKD
tara:strand:- start:315 stop:545 length:231 start_codon:yes stop_codon:yes gene_type:complete